MAGPAVSEEVARAWRQRQVEIDGCQNRTRLIGLLALSFYGSIQSQDAKKRTQIASVFCVHFTFSGWSQDSVTTLSSCTSST